MIEPERAEMDALQPPDYQGLIRRYRVTPREFPADLLGELREGRCRLLDEEETQHRERQAREQSLHRAAWEDLGPLWPFTTMLGVIRHDSEEVDFIIHLPSWPALRVRYRLICGSWQRLSFHDTLPAMTWAIVPEPLALPSEWVLAADRPEALARAERVVVPSPLLYYRPELDQRQ